MADPALDSTRRPAPSDVVSVPAPRKGLLDALHGKLVAMNARPFFRLIAPSAVMSIALLALGAVAALYLKGLQKASTELLVESINEIEAAEELEVASYELRHDLLSYATTHDASVITDMHHLRGDVDRWLTIASAGVDTPREQTLLDQIKRNDKRMCDDFEQLVTGAGSSPPPLLVERLYGRAESLILKPVGAFRDLTIRQAADASVRHQDVAKRTGVGLILLGSCGAVAGLVLGYGLAKRIHRSIMQLTIPIRDAAGRLDEIVGPITLFSGETFEEVERALKCVAERVANVVSQLRATQLAAIRSHQLASMGQLAAGLAHELRNPLTSMKMLLQPSADDETSVQLDVEDHVVLRQEVERLERTIQAFLDYARPPNLEQRMVDLCELVLQTVEFVRPRAERNGIQIQSNLACGRAMVLADAGQMRQVFLNLLLNAIDASFHGGTIEVRVDHEQGECLAGALQTGSSPSSLVVMEIADRGCGLPEELRDQIFKPFVTTKEGGTGLGLPICKRIVEEHGGVLAAQAREGGGAMFTVALRIAGTTDVPTDSGPLPLPYKPAA